MKVKKVIITCVLSTALLITANTGFAFEDHGKYLENWYKEDFKMSLNGLSKKIESTLSANNVNNELETHKNKLIDNVKDKIDKNNKMLIYNAKCGIHTNLNVYIDKIEMEKEELIKKNGFIESDFDRYTTCKKYQIDKALDKIIDQESKKLLCELNDTIE